MSGTTLKTSRRPATALNQVDPRQKSDWQAWYIAIGMIAYAWILHYAYKELISPVFYYLGQTYREPTTLGVSVSIISIVTLGTILPRRAQSISDFILWAFFLIAVAPSILIAQYADILLPDKAAQSSILISIIFAAIIVVSKSVKPKFGIHIRLPAELTQILAALFTITFTTILVTEGGASFSLVGLTQVQDVRASYKNAVDSLPFMGYAIQFQTAVLNPVFMSAGVVKRRPVVLTAGVVGQLLIYSVTGYKLTALSPIFVIALALVLRKRDNLPGATLTSAIVGTMFGSVVMDIILGGRLFVTIFTNRLIAAPGVLTAAYLMVFDGQEKYRWSYSFLSPFFESPYDLTPGYLVALLFQKVNSQANANLFGDGYANWGWPGVIIEALFLVLVLIALEASGRGIPLAITAPSTLVAALGLANNSAFTSVLTGGFGGLVLVFALWPRDQVSSDDGSTPRTADQDMNH